MGELDDLFLYQSGQLDQCSVGLGRMIQMTSIYGTKMEEQHLILVSLFFCDMGHVLQP